MIPMNVEQRLGRHTWLLLLSKKTTTSVVFLLLAVILGSSKDFVGAGLSGFSGFVQQINGVPIDQAISSVVSFAALVILIIGVILFLVGYAIARLQFQHYTFTLEEFGIKLKKGIINIREISIPYRQIQSVDVTQTLFYQLFHVSRLILLTAGEDEGKAHDAANDTVFDPIDDDIAEEIRSILQRRIGVQVVEGTADSVNIDKKI